MAHPSRSLRRGVGGGNPAPAPERGRRQAQGNDNYRVVGGKIPRPVQHLAAPHPATAITGLAGTARSGPGSLLPPGASTGPRGPDRFHPLQLPGSHHRRPPLPPPAFSGGTESFGLALRRGGHWRDLPGPEAGTTERLVDLGRGAAGDPFRQHLGPHPRDKAQPRPGPQRQLHRALGALRSRVHSDQFRGVPRKRCRRAGPLPPQGRHRPGPHAARQPRFQFRQRLRRLRQEGGGPAQPAGAGKAGAGTPSLATPAASSGAGVP